MAYASKYYDPVKAHEYYMQHRELKKRKSTAKLNDKGKAAAKMVKERLTEERKAAQQKVKADADQQIQALRGRVQTFRDQIKDFREQIKAFRQRMKGMSKEQKAQMKQQLEAFKGQLEGFKGQLESLKAEVKGQVDQIRSHVKAEKKKIKEQYDEKYMQELDKIKADSSMKKISKKQQKLINKYGDRYKKWIK